MQLLSSWADKKIRLWFNICVRFSFVSHWVKCGISFLSVAFMVSPFGCGLAEMLIVCCCPRLWANIILDWDAKPIGRLYITFKILVQTFSQWHCLGLERKQTFPAGDLKKKKKNISENTQWKQTATKLDLFFFLHTNRIQVQPCRVKKNKGKVFKAGRDTATQEEEEQNILQIKEELTSWNVGWQQRM